MIRASINAAKTCLATVLLALLALLAFPGAAQATRPGDVLQAELRPGWRTADGTHMTALHLRLADGWMTYWRVPGAGGLPLRIDWAGSTNLRGARKHWPAPTIFNTNGHTNYGFARELVLPIEIAPEDAGAPITLDAAAVLGVCKDICIPVDLHLRGTLGAPGSHDPLIEASLARTPRPARDSGLRDIRCTLTPDERGGLRLAVELDMPSLGPSERLVIEAPGRDIRARALGSTRNGSTLRGEALLRERGGAAPAALDRSRLRMTVLSDAGAVEHRGCALER